MKKVNKRFVAKKEGIFLTPSNEQHNIEKGSVWNVKNDFEDDNLDSFYILQETADIKNEIIVPNDLFFNFCFQQI